jgi:small subunit ribosomal protein S17
VSEQEISTQEDEVVATETAQTEATSVGDSSGAVQQGGGGRNYRKVRIGYVTSDKMDKTIVVEVEDHVKHALYGKIMRRTSKLKAHDEQNSAGLGDRVLLMETRPLSATKRWRLVEVLEKAK